ncbi:hypothetical protein DNH61_12225 [Paenibacillus sambharensis]|uniref:Lipoprotein n=1 Tax=Paenibacillus sambharensis TaxID=1803190 RepID=A0A2W1LB02_9BACL|nr:hypothetical protein [Paenibacillus sambharensis]PZD95310.1 hypothetical protein DNH61_12225 [Paenibacillus sambharensis]
MKKIIVIVCLLLFMTACSKLVDVSVDLGKQALKNGDQAVKQFDPSIIEQPANEDSAAQPQEYRHTESFVIKANEIYASMEGLRASIGEEAEFLTVQDATEKLPEVKIIVIDAFKLRSEYAPSQFKDAAYSLYQASAQLSALYKAVSEDVTFPGIKAYDSHIADFKAELESWTNHDPDATKTP